MADEVVVITGASAGVGRAVAHEFARRGASIGLLARGIEALEATKREVEELGGRAITIPIDVANHDDVEAAAQRVEEALGPIDIWINNAMVSVFSPIRELKPEELRRVTDVTYHGYVWGTMAALRRMQPRDRGVIVQVGSALAYRGIPLQAAYCAAKHAIQGFNDSLYSELLHDRSNVRLTMVNLPAINTPQFDWVLSRLPGRAQPVGEVFQPEVAARAIVWAAYHERRELNVGWPTTQAIVGNNLIPGYVDRYLAWTAFEGQQTDEPEDPNRAHNLWKPLPGEHATHGRFDDIAKPRSLHLAMNVNRTVWTAVALATALGVWALTRRR
jgi:NAD(P)-dependent dehydrogenase (short-subunit alcohol dehydrogenase family)